MTGMFSRSPAPFLIWGCGRCRRLSEGVRGERTDGFSHRVDQPLELQPLVLVHDADGVAEGLLVELVQEGGEEAVQFLGGFEPGLQVLVVPIYLLLRLFDLVDGGCESGGLFRLGEGASIVVEPRLGAEVVLEVRAGQLGDDVSAGFDEGNAGAPC
ncbi:hypothetical protein [Streptomyces olivaceus]|uniref:hypothetical protein n=1 Tax=Streptomyces olivaceus TaxID=47716 RepID=UPI00188574D6|nr:hypothetical protein [Streptomyces olivaceus]